MHHVAVNLFDSINFLRYDQNPCDAYYEIWAKRECLRNFNDISLPKYEWNEALARAGRHVINEMGACGTLGDANGDYVQSVLSKYYTYDYEGLDFIKVTGQELVNLDDWENTGKIALEYILA